MIFCLTIVFSVSVRHSFRNPWPAVLWMAWFLGLYAAAFLGLSPPSFWEFFLILAPLISGSHISFLVFCLIFVEHVHFTALWNWCMRNFLRICESENVFILPSQWTVWPSVKFMGGKSLFLQNFEVIIPPFFELQMLLLRILVPCWFLWLGFSYLFFVPSLEASRIFSSCVLFWSFTKIRLGLGLIHLSGFLVFWRLEPYRSGALFANSIFL